jgi:hypothetical protein
MTDKRAETVARESPVFAMAVIFLNPFLRRSALRCLVSIFRNFFFLQYWGALFPGKIPVFRVDHPLDEKIPFRPRYITVYLDFVAFWVRALGFLLRFSGRRALLPVRDFIVSMGRLYGFAAEVYAKGFSTTPRPRYLARPRFVLVHALDPHLMCIPSLHVMVVVRTYTKIRAILASLGAAETRAVQIDELWRGALEITGAVLYVKQHSINCIAAALYAMTRFDGVLFPPEEAERFIGALFTGAAFLAPADVETFRAHILGLYRRFLEEGRIVRRWEAPLIAFLRSSPQV